MDREPEVSMEEVVRKMEDALRLGKRIAADNPKMTWNERAQVMHELKRSMGLCAGIHPWK